MTNINTKFTHRFLARIVMEATTQLAVGSGDKDITTDALVVKDVNGLPYIPGTSIAGVLRHAIGENEAKTFFGYQTPGKSKDSKGSEIIFTEAKIIGEEGKVIDKIQILNSDFYNYFKELPIRQHVAINDKGVAIEGGKFDQQVVYKGTRFCFEIEMVSDGNNWSKFEDILKQLQMNTFRIGSGTRNGSGEIKIISCTTNKLDLTTKEGLEKYLNKSSCLSINYDGDSYLQSLENEDWIKYELILSPDDFFLFGSGFGDDEVDMIPVKEDYIVWENEKPKFVNDAILIPATSIKGALSHRVAFYYNKQKKIFADNISLEEYRLHLKNSNNAVTTLFGADLDKKEDGEKRQIRGNVIFSDIIEKRDVTEKILNHVAIDRFTGGGIDGALFSEKTIYGEGQKFEIKILVNKDCLVDTEIKIAFESALKDICNGLLPLGGGVNRGNGLFNGILKCNGKIHDIQ